MEMEREGLRRYHKQVVKLLFTTMYFVGFYSVPNLIVIIINRLYPVFIVGFVVRVV